MEVGLIFKHMEVGHRSRRDQGDKGPSTKCSLLLCNRVSPDPAVGGVSEDHARPRRAHAGHMNLESSEALA